MSVIISTVHSHLSVTAFALHKANLLKSDNGKDFDKVTDAFEYVFDLLGTGRTNFDAYSTSGGFYYIALTIGDEVGEFKIRRSTGRVFPWHSKRLVTD